MSQFILWLDLETGGLDGRLDNGKLGMEHYPILEIACVLTDTDLKPVSAIRIPVFQPESELNKLSDWALKTHSDSGLLAECKSSDITLDKAERVILNWLAANGCNAYDRASKTGAVLAGNSIGFDRNFIRCQMPKLHNYLHYRMLDVSALALHYRFNDADIEKAAISHKTRKHRALDDIAETISEYYFYRALPAYYVNYKTMSFEFFVGDRLTTKDILSRFPECNPVDYLNPSFGSAA